MIRFKINLLSSLQFSLQVFPLKFYMHFLSLSYEICDIEFFSVTALVKCKTYEAHDVLFAFLQLFPISKIQALPSAPRSQTALIHG